MARLTTHVLDTAQGKPAAGVAIGLFHLDGIARSLVADVTTNADGRTDRPLLSGVAAQSGTFELVFAIGAYFATQPVTLHDPPFLDEITIRFTMAPDGGDYHVPLLVSPWAYSTYRGS